MKYLLAIADYFIFLMFGILIAGCAKQNVNSQLEANKAIVMRAWEEAFNQGKMDLVKEIFDENYVESSPYKTYEPRGPERVIEADEWMKSVFGYLHFQVEQMIAEGDFVFSRAMATGTHIGEFMGVSATGKPVRFAVVVVSKIKNGKIVRDWSFVDTETILSQIRN